MRVTAFTLPSRDPDAPAAAARARRVAQLLARQLGGRFVDAQSIGGPRADDVGAMIARAQRLEAGGALDEAAATYDVVLARGTRSLHRLSDPASFVTASVARASIALARREANQARDLLARLCRYDAGFTLATTEDRPSMRAILAEVCRPHGPRPTLGAEDFGEVCGRGPDVVVVSRRLGRGAYELVRLDDCREVAHESVTPAMSDAEVATLLAGGALAPATRPAERRPGPWWSRPWVWATLGAMVLGGVIGGTYYAVTSRGTELRVVPHW